MLRAAIAFEYTMSVPSSAETLVMALQPLIGENRMVITAAMTKHQDVNPPLGCLRAARSCLHCRRVTVSTIHGWGGWWAAPDAHGPGDSRVLCLD